MTIYNYEFKDGFKLEAVKALSLLKKRQYIMVHGRIVKCGACGWLV